MTEEQLYREAYNAHERAETVMLNALQGFLGGVSVDGLACLADPAWCWETRSHLSADIVEMASEVLDEKLEAMLEMSA